MRRFVFGTVFVLMISLVTLAIMEIALRIRPELIPLGLLVRFQEDLALDVATRRQLPRRSQVWQLERDDGGPALQLFLPFAEYDLNARGAGTKHRMHLDANGFCNPLPDGGYAAESIDLITLGDSFTWCHTLTPEETWTYELADRLDQTAYCLGMGGIGPYEHLQILKRFGLSKSPEIVVMNVYGGNDLRDALRYRSYVEGGTAQDASSFVGDLRAPVDNFLGRRSYAFNLVAAAATLGVEIVGNAIQRRLAAQGRVEFRYSLDFPEGVVGFNFSNTDRDEVRHAAALSMGTIDLDVFDAALAQLMDLSREHGFLAVVSYTPSAHIVYEKWAVFDDPAIEKPLAELDRAQREYLARKSRELGFVFVDGTPALQKEAAEKRGEELLYYQWDLHFTRAGNRVMAREIAGAIESARP